MNTIVTFRVADGMLVENARERNPDDEILPPDPEEYREDIREYRAHVASLRSIPIAPGCVFEGDALKEDIDFWIGCECDRQGRRGIACLCFCCYGKKAYPVEKELKVALIGHAMQWVDVLPVPENPSSKHWRDCVLDFPLTWSEAEQRIENGLPETVEYLAPAPITYTPAQVIADVFADFPDNSPLYLDSGLWQLRSDDMEQVLAQQESNEVLYDFLSRCKDVNLFY